MRSGCTRTFEARGEGASSQTLEETNELLRPCNSMDPWLLLVLVRIALFLLRSLPFSGENGVASIFRALFHAPLFASHLGF